MDRKRGIQGQKKEDVEDRGKIGRKKKREQMKE